MIDLKKPKLQLAVLFGTLGLYLVANAFWGGPDNPYNFIPPLIGVAILIEIVAFVGMEVKQGAKEHGWKHEVVDTLIALAVAVAIWFGASFLLNTSSPISGVVSCSMLPNLQRGDFVIVQGAPVKAHEISMTEGELKSLTESRSLVLYSGKNISIDGTLFPYCLVSPNSEVCHAFHDNPESIVEQKGAFTYRYERCPISLSDGGSTSIPCLKSVAFKGREYLMNFSSDIIVYQPPPGDFYSVIGDIVHRAYFKIDVDGKSFYLTRGDNNPVMDMQVFDYGAGRTNRPIPEDYVRGKVIGRIPVLGYFKLFVAGHFKEDSQCSTQLEFTHD